MDKSKLENIGNTQLFFIIKSILIQIDMDTIVRDSDIMNDSDFIGICEESGKIVGIYLDFPIDQNYLAATIKLNRNFDFSDKKPMGLLSRPEAGLYSFDIDEYRTEYVRRTYRHELTSYSKELLPSTISILENEGSFEYYDGDEIDTDYYDGDTTNVKLDKDSIRKIK